MTATLEFLACTVNHDAVIRLPEGGTLYLRNFDRAHARPGYDFPIRQSVPGIGKPFDMPCPWFLSGGYFFPSPEAALEWVNTPKPKTSEHSGITYTGYGANTHAPSYN